MPSKPTSIIKLALTADNHRNLSRRRAESDRVHNAMLEEWKRREVDFIGFAGDFNECGMSDEDVIANAKYLRECAQIAPTFLIDGNHGIPGELGIYDHRIWPLAGANQITVEPHAGVHVIKTRKGPLAVAGVSFPQKQHLIATLGDIPLEDIDRIASEQLRNLFLGLGVKVRELGLPTIALIHGTVTGSKFSDARPPTTEGMILGLHDIHLIGADLTVVGHYHLGSDFKVNSASIVIPGSPYRNNHGESDTKSWVYAEFDTSVVNAEPGVCASWTRVPTNCQPMLHLEADYNPETQSLDYRDVRELPNMANADVRLRYHFDKEHAQAAKEMAEIEVKCLYDAGAEAVKPEPIANPGSTVRDSEIIKATTLEEKIQKLWTAKGFEPGERRAALLLKVDELLSTCGFGQRLNLDASIQLKNVRLKGFRCFQNEVNLNLDSLPGDIIAVHGPNGVGKSLFWELAVCGALYRDVPTHGHIGDHVLDKGTFTEAEFIYDGKTYLTKQLLNMSGGGSASLKINGETALKSALRSEYDKWAAENLPPFSLFTATSFAPQESKGILGMSKSERKALVLRAKGVERYEVLAETARKKATEIADELSQVSARMGELGLSATPPAVYENEILKLEDEKQRLEEEFRSGEKTLADLRDRNTAIDKERSDYESKVTERKRLEAEQIQLQERMGDINTRIANNQEVVDQADAIRNAHIEVDSLRQQLDNLQDIDRDLRTKEADLRADIALHEGNQKRWAQGQDGQIRDVQDLESIIKGRTAAQSAVDSLEDFTRAVRECERERDAALTLYEEVQSQGTRTEAARVKFLRGELTEIEEERVERPANYAGSALRADELSAKESDEHPLKLRRAKAAWLQADERAKEANRQLGLIQAQADKMTAVEEAEKKKAGVEVNLAASEKELQELSTLLTERHTALAETRIQIASHTLKAKGVSAEINKLNPLAGRLDVLNSAEARLEELSAQQARAAADLELNKEIAHELSFLSKPPDPVPLFEYERAVANVRDSLSTNQTSLALAQTNLKYVRSVEQRQKELNAQATTLRDTVADWTRLAQDLGRDGLQAEEVAGASAEINEIANELLRSSGDTQYTIELSTTKLTKDGKKEVEGCPINVYNSETGQWQPGETLSPGQRAFVNLALSLTFATIGCKGLATRPTIFLDEPTAGLSEDKRPFYLAMLRYALRKNNASKILYVAHTRDLIDAADGRIGVSDGKLVIS